MSLNFSLENTWKPSNLCHIYNHEPFDCRIWPFLITKSQDGQSIHLVYFTRENCPSLGCINREEFEAYRRYIMDYVMTPEFLKLLHAHEALIWDWQEGTRFVADLTEKVKDEGGRMKDRDSSPSSHSCDS